MKIVVVGESGLIGKKVASVYNVVLAEPKYWMPSVFFLVAGVAQIIVL